MDITDFQCYTNGIQPLFMSPSVCVTLIPTMRNAFDVLAEGLFVQSSRGDWTPVELFLRGAASIEAHIRRLILAFIQGTPPQN